MKTIKKIIKLGNTYVISLPRDIIKSVKKGDTCLFNIELINILKRKKEIVNYRCLACEYDFNTEDEEPYCPACNNEKLEIMRR